MKILSGPNTSHPFPGKRVLGMIKRNFGNCPKNVKISAYTAMVRPKLEYACAAWDPYLQKDIALLERIQRKAAPFCSNNYHPTASVTEILQDLDVDVDVDTGVEFKRNAAFVKKYHAQEGPSSSAGN